jgi:peptidoglycan/xylan/chitin deacetylase (PgdA/CDA1 family)
LITFDDGYSDIYYNAYPILKKYNFKAVVFLIINCLGSPEYLTEEQVKEMKDIISFQSHTLNHFELDKINKKALENECSLSKSEIEELTGEPVNTLSYPAGRYNQTVIDAVSKYYVYAVTTKSGYYNKDNGNYKIKRIRIQRSDTLKNFIAKLSVK